MLLMKSLVHFPLTHQNMKLAVAVQLKIVVSFSDMLTGFGGTKIPKRI